MVDSTGTCEAIDAKAALAMNTDPGSPWSEEWLCTQVKERSDGIRYAMSAEQGGSLIVLGPDGKKVFPMDPGHLRLESANVISKSAEDGFWVFEGLGDQLTEHYDGKKWERFPKEKWNELQQRVVAVQQIVQPMLRMAFVNRREVMVRGQRVIRNNPALNVAATMPFPEDCPIPATDRLWCRQKDDWTFELPGLDIGLRTSMPPASSTET